MALYEYKWPRSAKGQLQITVHKRTGWDGKKRRVKPAQLRKFVKFKGNRYGTNDANEARAIEATPQFGQEIHRVGQEPKAPAPKQVSTLAAIEKVLARLGGLPAGDEDGEFGGFEMPRRVEVA